MNIGRYFQVSPTSVQVLQNLATALTFIAGSDIRERCDSALDTLSSQGRSDSRKCSTGNEVGREFSRAFFQGREMCCL